MENISKHVSYNEAIRSNTAIRMGLDNHPSAMQVWNMQLLCKMVFEPLRFHFAVPIRISSMFRGKALNKAVKGSSRSQHCKGEAMDIQGTNGVSNAELYYFIRDNLDFDQLIWEYGNDKEPAWIHVSFTDSKPNRRQTLRIF